MEQDLTIPEPQSRCLVDPSIEARVEALHGRLEPHPSHPTRYCVPRASAATTAERQALCAARSRLQRELEPWSNRKHVDAVVSRMLLGFELGKGSSQANIVRLVAEYIEAVKGKPFSEIYAAAARFRSAETLTKWKPGFRPNTAEFAAEVREGMVQPRTHLLHINRVLDAEVYDPPTQEQQDAVAEAAAEYARTRATLGPDGQPRPQPSEEEIGAAREAVIRDGADRLRQIAGAEDGRGLTHLMARLDAKRGIQNAGASA